MPATESTWRDTGRLHRLFAISGVVLTIATVWMFYKDHARSWKVIQPAVVNIDLTMNRWRQEQYDTTGAILEHERLSRAVAAAQSRPLDPELRAQFKQKMELDAKYRQVTVSTQWIDDRAKDLEPLAAAAARLRLAATEAQRASDAKPQDRELFLAAAAAESAALAAEEQAGAARASLLAKLGNVINEAKIRENKVLGERKTLLGRIDAAKASLDIAIRDNLGAAEIQRRQKDIDRMTTGKSPQDERSFAFINERYQTLSGFRKDLDKIVKQMTAAADEAQKKYDDSLVGLERLKTQYQQQDETYFTLSSQYPFFLGKKILSLPIIDAFNSTRKIDNLWSEGLEQTYGSFGQVRRFDRCTTCHQSLAKSLTGQPTAPAYIQEQDLDLVVTPPPKGAPPEPRLDQQGNEVPLTVEDWLGIRLAGEGLLKYDDVTVSLVQPKSPAARAEFVPSKEPDQPGLKIRQAVARQTSVPGSSTNPFPTLPGLLVGDVITGINGSVLLGGDRGVKRVAAQLLTLAQEGKPIRLLVRRGLPNPYISHPRLDLYVADASPHRLQTFACTVCHEGQGSATDFKWAGHAPNTQLEAARWTNQYGWFDNPHWAFPMFAERFAQSACLKCHHQVVDLEASEKYPEAPAPKVVHGYQLIRKYGCFGCHEINGFDGPIRRIGPDLRAEPNYFAAAQALLPLLPARQALYQSLAAQKAEQIKPLVEQLDQAAADKAKLDEQKSKIDPAAADKDQQTKAVDEQIAVVTARQQDLNKTLASVRAEQTAAGRHLDAIARAARLSAELTAHPELDGVRHELQQILDDDVRIEADNKDKPVAQKQWTAFNPPIHAMAGWFKDQEVPGDQRKPGPSLRYLAAKIDRAFLYDWLNNPTNFRKTTRMPRFFGLWNHLKNEHGQMTDQIAPQREPIEIRGLVEFLLAQSQGQLPDANENAGGVQVEKLVQLYEPLPHEKGIDAWTDEEKVSRGKVQFQTRGCLACHPHKDFPEVAGFRKPEEIVQGPDLSAVGDKFNAERNPRGPDWLYSWIKQPTRYHARTVMPNLFLGPEKDPGADPLDPKDDKWFDPADDIASYLLTSRSPWKPVPQAAGADQPLDAAGLVALKDLTLEYLNQVFYADDATDYFVNGIPPELESELKGAEKDLVVQPGQKLTDTQRLRYIGRRTVAKYGCFGCHDIPGFEDAKPIGTSLADWGRKDPARLAFEHITHYIEGHGHGAAGPTANDTGPGEVASETLERAEVGEKDTIRQESEDFYRHALVAGNRIGFIQQKLKEPRSFDFEKIENKRFNERLRMPQFPFTLEEREAVITFVLGLVADPPREKYIFQPKPRTEALIAGRKVLEKFNCAGCHLLGVEKWQIAYPPGTFGPQSPPEKPLVTFPFLRPPVSPKDVLAQATPDQRNLLHSHLVGLPKISPKDGLPEVLDPDGAGLTNEDPFNPADLRLSLDLWQPTLIDGDLYLTGQTPIKASRQQIEKRYPPWGGVLTRYLLPVVTGLEKQANPNASGAEAYGWLPPPLVGEGDKVQLGWLHDFLLEPYPLRPATFLRMPRFNMSSREATDLVKYFAAADNTAAPFELAVQRLDSELAAKARAYGQALDQAGVAGADGRSWSQQPTDALIDRRFDDAMKIVVDGNYCVKCHNVSDYQAPGRERAKAPNLSDVQRRLKPDYLRRWIAKPNAILPYTSMPENIKFEPEKPFQGGVSQELFHGTSTEQVDGLVDLLTNFDIYARRGRRIADMVKPIPMPPAGAPAATGNSGP